MRSAAKKTPAPAHAPAEEAAAAAPASSEPNAPDGVEVGGHVWYAERENGRSTEHLARVLALTERAGVLKLSVKDNGETRVIDDVAPWGTEMDQRRGWWKV